MKPLLKIDYQRIGEKSLLTKPVYIDEKVREYLKSKERRLCLHEDIKIGQGHSDIVLSIGYRRIYAGAENAETFDNVKEREDFILGLDYVNSEFISLPEEKGKETYSESFPLLTQEDVEAAISAVAAINGSEKGTAEEHSAPYRARSQSDIMRYLINQIGPKNDEL